MFDRLDDLLRKFEEIMNELSEPDVANNQERFRALMKEQSNLTPIVNAYREYKKCNQDIEDSLSMLESESDEEMREMLKEELSEAKKRVEALEKELGLPQAVFHGFRKPEERAADFAFGPGDLVVVGSPTYAGRMPNKIAPDFQARLRGDGALAVAAA